MILQRLNSIGLMLFLIVEILEVGGGKDKIAVYFRHNVQAEGWIYFECLREKEDRKSENIYNGLNGGAVAAVAERLATACARTVVPEDKSLFLGEMSVSYLSAAPVHAVLIADASLVRSGRNLTVVSVELKLKETAKLVYTAHATFFHLPASKL